MSGNPADRVLKQSLLEFKDQMSVYSTQPWSAENGHGYNEMEQFAMRDGPMMAGRNPNTRQPNAMEPRRNTEREIDINSHTNVQCHFENTRYVSIGFNFKCLCSKTTEYRLAQSRHT